MNRRCYRLVFNPLRGMRVAVAETVTGARKTAGSASAGSTSRSARAARRTPSVTLFPLRHVAFAAAMLAGLLPLRVDAQVVADPNAGVYRPVVISTQNGLPQVNITAPSGAGVSVNHYAQFDVAPGGVILNNSPVIVQTQQAGQINGNPNLAPGQSAQIILNQVNSRAPSQLRGHIEVAGNRAQVVLANGSGIVVDGGGFINTTRGILTTGSPLFGANGSLNGFNVTGGQIAVEGRGFNATNLDQVDLIARAVKANADIHANRLNVVTGANRVDHETLATTAIAGDGPVPGVSIDTGDLGGMYGNSIFMVGTEQGVGVSLKGVLAAQAGDLTLTTEGKLILAGETRASGRLALSARDGIDNQRPAKTYGHETVTLSTGGRFDNGGTLAARLGLDIEAHTVSSSGTLGAGVNADSQVVHAGELKVVARGMLAATGLNLAGGAMTLEGAALDLAGSQTRTKGALTLTARERDVNLAGVISHADGALSVKAGGALVNDGGALWSDGPMKLAAARFSNIGGQIVSYSTLDVQGGALDNRRGVIEAAGRVDVQAASLDNTAGRLVSLNGDGLRVKAEGRVTNVAGVTANGSEGGVVGTKGALDITATALSNQGQLNADGNATLDVQSLDNHAGIVNALGVLSALSSGTLNNQHGTLSGSTTKVRAASIDNTSGHIKGDHLDVSTPGDLLNRDGAIRQFGSSDATLTVDGTFDNTSGTLESNAANLVLSTGVLTNDHGLIRHAGADADTLRVTASGAASNRSGRILTNGALDAHLSRLDNTAGTLSAQHAATIDATSDVITATVASMDKTA